MACKYSPRTGLSRPITCFGHSVMGRRFRLSRMFASIRDQRPLPLRKVWASILCHGSPFVAFPVNPRQGRGLIALFQSNRPATANRRQCCPLVIHRCLLQPMRVNHVRHVEANSAKTLTGEVAGLVLTTLYAKTWTLSATCPTLSPTCATLSATCATLSATCATLSATCRPSAPSARGREGDQ